jgi:hypothetical protein
MRWMHCKPRTFGGSSPTSGSRSPTTCGTAEHKFATASKPNKSSECARWRERDLRFAICATKQRELDRLIAALDRRFSALWSC